MFLFLVGPPGSGKSTLMRAFLGMRSGGELPLGSYLVPKPKWTVVQGDGVRVAAAGHYTGATFDGADTVAYNGVAGCLAYWDAHLQQITTTRVDPLTVTIFDGDRFSHEKVAAWCKVRGRVLALHLGAPQDVLDARRAERGSKQNPSWMAGRVTKAARFAETNAGAHLDGSQPVEALVGQLRAMLSSPA